MWNLTWLKDASRFSALEINTHICRFWITVLCTCRCTNWTAKTLMDCNPTKIAAWTMFPNTLHQNYKYWSAYYALHPRCLFMILHPKLYYMANGVSIIKLEVGTNQPILLFRSYFLLQWFWKQTVLRISSKCKNILEAFITGFIDCLLCVSCAINKSCIYQ